MAMISSNEAFDNLNNFQIYVKGNQRFWNKCYMLTLMYKCGICWKSLA